MMVIHVQVKTSPEKRGEFVAAMHTSENNTRNFPGCLKYEWLESISAPNTFTLYEEWVDASAFDAYKASPHFEQLGQLLRPLFAEAPQSDYYTAEVYAKS